MTVGTLLWLVEGRSFTNKFRVKIRSREIREQVKLKEKIRSIFYIRKKIYKRWWILFLLMTASTIFFSHARSVSASKQVKLLPLFPYNGPVESAFMIGRWNSWPPALRLTCNIFVKGYHSLSIIYNLILIIFNILKILLYKST